LYDMNNKKWSNITNFYRIINYFVVKLGFLYVNDNNNVNE
jgi:hypothetical protein